MNVSEMITLGVGTPSDIPHLVLTGLSPVTLPSSFGILSDVPAALTAEVVYALPTRCSRIEWQSLVAADLYLGLVNSKLSIIDSSVGAEIRVIDAAATFIKSNVDVIVTCRSQRF